MSTNAALSSMTLSNCSALCRLAGVWVGGCTSDLHIDRAAVTAFFSFANTADAYIVELGC